MGRWLELVARLTMAPLLAAGLLVTPGASSGVAVARASGCPSATIQRLIGDGSVTCYGSHTLTFQAYVQRPCNDGCGGTAASMIGPRWLDAWEGSYAMLGSGPRSASISAFVPPALGRCSAFANLTSCPFHSYQSHWATVRARFNDPIARTCRYAQHPPGAEFSKKIAIAECKTKLVVLSIGPAAPETDVASGLAERPAAGNHGLPWLPWLPFIVTLLLAACWFPIRRLASGPDAGRT